jgi:putative ABC transport system ATP-binding protein
MTAPATATDMVAVEAVTKTYGTGRAASQALRGVTFAIAPGQLVALRGRSGSGKTTLLNIIGGLDRADSGSVRVAGHDVTACSSSRRVRCRATSAGASARC